MTEWAGSLTLPFNGVLTAALGAWLGLKGFLGYFLKSKILFQGLIALSMGLGVWIAVINYRHMKRSIQRRVEERTLQDIQLHILDFLIKKRQTEIGQKTDELNVLLKTMKVADEEIPPIPSTEFDSEKKCLQWLERFECVVGKHRELDNPRVYDLFEGAPQVIDFPGVVVVDSHCYFRHRHNHYYSGMLHNPGNDESYERLREQLFAGIQLL